MTRLLTFIFFILTVSSCDSPLFSTFLKTESTSQASDGVLDLRGHGFKTLVTLSGQWKFYPAVQIISEPRVNRPSGEVTIQVPQWWDEILAKDFKNLPKGQGFGSYSLTLILPDNIVNSELTFYLNHFLGSYRLFIYDGVSLHAFRGAGSPSVNQATNIDRCWEVVVERFIPRANVITITIEASNFTYGSGGFHTAPSIGLTKITEAALLKHRAICFFVIGALIVCLLFNFSLILLHKDNGQTFWILLLCGATLYNFLHRVFPTIVPDAFETRLFMLSFHLLFIAYLTYFYKTTVQLVAPAGTKLGVILHWIPSLLKHVVGIFTFCMLFTPSTYTIFFIEVFRGVPLLMILYMIFAVIWLLGFCHDASREIRVETIIHSVSIAGLSFAGLISVFFHGNKRIGADSSDFLAQTFGGIALVLSQTLSVLYRSSVLRRQAEEGRHQLELIVRENFSLESAVKRKTDFIAIMNHEIRTPLNHILGFSEVLFKELKGSRHGKWIQKIIVQTKWLTQLINSLIDASRLETDAMDISPQWIVIRDFFSEIHGFFAYHIELKGLYHRVIFAANLPSKCYIDDVRLRQVIINVVSNAIKYTKRGGITITISEENGCLVVRIADTGIGINDADKKTVFTPFNRGSRSGRAQDGVGLGLSIAARLVKKMNGSITLDSEPGMGTTFEIVFKDAPFEPVKPLPVEEPIEEHPLQSGIVHMPSDQDSELYLFLQAQLGRCSDLKSRKVFSEIMKFAAEIRALGKSFESEDWILYGDRLAKHVDSFDVDGINRELAYFQKMVGSKSSST